MRLLQRETQKVYISRYLGLSQGVDQKGRLTGRDVISRSEPEAFYPSVSAAKGDTSEALFGQLVEYDRIIIVDDVAFQAAPSDVFWIDVPVTGKYDYIATRVAHKGHLTIIAVRKIEVSE